MSKATMTLIGMYRYNSDLFSNLTLPDGIDKESTIDNILVRAGEFEVLYPDYDFMKEMIGLISRKWQRTFQKWYNALQLEYNPIENYDRYENWKDSGTVDHKTDGKESVKATSNDHSNADSSTDSSVSAYDSDAMHPDGHTSSHQSASSDGYDATDTKRNESDNESRDLNHTGHIHGNIGVTTSQQMLEAELDLQSWNLYEHIADIFVRELCIPVY